MNKTKICNKCKRELPLDSDHFNHKCDTKDGWTSQCKECRGRHFTDYLTNIPKEGHVFCNKCKRELPHDYWHFPTANNPSGLKKTCRECDGLRFLPKDFQPYEKWTEEEDSILLKYHNDYSVREIHEKFLPNRTITTIEVRGRNLHKISFKSDEKKKIKKRQERANHYLERLQEKHNGKIICINIEDYIDTNTKLKHHCNIHNFDFPASPKSVLDEVYACPVCSGNVILRGVNDLWTTHPHIAELLTNPEDGYSISYGCNSKKVNFTCPECGEISKKTPLDVSYNGFNCKKCSDGISYPEKFVFELFNQLGLSFETHKVFDWLIDRYYDFYLTDYNILCETHGLQHYKDGFVSVGGRTHEQEQENDKIKMETALKNGISDYIILDCRYSDFDWIKNSIIQSGIIERFGKTVDDINWVKCGKSAMSSRMLETCKLWNNGKSISEICEYFKMHTTTIREYLKKGAKAGICSYDSKKEMGTSKARKAICLNDLETYDSLSDFARKHNISVNNISSCCKGRTHTIDVNGSKFVVKYYEDYLKMTDEEISECLKYINTQSSYKNGIFYDIICLNNGLEFDTEKSALKWLNKKSTANCIQRCCRGEVTYAYKKDGENLVWMYKKDYEKATEQEIQERLFNGLHYSVNGIMIVCTDTNQIFNSFKDAGVWCGLKNREPIKKCCEGLKETAGKHPDTGKPLHWKFYTDYIKKGATDGSAFFSEE